MKVAAIQHDIVWESRGANLARLGPMVQTAAGAGARLVVLTEMFATGFSMDTDAIAESSDGEAPLFLCEQAQRHDVWVCGSISVREPGETLARNVFTLAGPDGSVHRYAKIHPFSYAGEHERYEAGTERLTFDVDGVRVTPFVCYDLRFADEFWAMAAGTDVYVVPANWPAKRRRHWQALLAARAIENQAYVVGVNRVGIGNGLEYAGDTCIIDPLGEVLASAAGSETIVLADVDPAVVAATRERYPFLPDRR